MDSDCWNPSISADGRFVAFESDATNLVRGDTNSASDIFVHDRVTSETTRVSVSSTGRQGSSDSSDPAISADGRFVAFSTESTLSSDDRYGDEDIYVHDSIKHETSLVISADLQYENVFNPSISSDGRFIAFHGYEGAYVYDRRTGETVRIDKEQWNASSQSPAISADGRFVAFSSSVSILVPNDTNGGEDIFVYDHQTKTTEQVSVGLKGQEANDESFAPVISSDGRYVAFRSLATNLVKGDNNWFEDTFLYDRQTKKTTLVSLASNGTQGNDHSYGPAISGDGRFVAFTSRATNLVSGDTNDELDLFVRDRLLQPGKSADLVLTQTESADPVTKGSILTYRVKVTNKGPDSASNVTLTDTIPVKAALQSVTPSQGECSTGPLSVCRLGTIASGESATVTLTLKAKQPGVLKNVAFVNAGPDDPKPANNTRKITTKVE